MNHLAGLLCLTCYSEEPIVEATWLKLKVWAFKSWSWALLRVELRYFLSVTRLGQKVMLRCRSVSRLSVVSSLPNPGPEYPNPYGEADSFIKEPATAYYQDTFVVIGGLTKAPAGSYSSRYIYKLTHQPNDEWTWSRINKYARRRHSFAAVSMAPPDLPHCYY